MEQFLTAFAKAKVKKVNWSLVLFLYHLEVFSLYVFFACLFTGYIKQCQCHSCSLCQKKIKFYETNLIFEIQMCIAGAIWYCSFWVFIYSEIAELNMWQLDGTANRKIEIMQNIKIKDQSKLWVSKDQSETHKKNHPMIALHKTVWNRVKSQHVQKVLKNKTKHKYTAILSLQCGTKRNNIKIHLKFTEMTLVQNVLQDITTFNFHLELVLKL